MQKPDGWSDLTPEEKREIRLDAWVNGVGVAFDSAEAEEQYKKRAALFRDAVQLEEPPERVPVAGLGGGYALERAGVPQKATFYDDWERASEAVIQFHEDFDPDSAMFLFLMSGPAFDCLGHTLMRWPGGGLPDDVQYQFLEQEYMKADEYDHFLEDPSDYVLRKYLPRVNTELEGLEKLPQFAVDGMGFGPYYMAFLDPEVQKALDALRKAAELSIPPAQVTQKTMTRLSAMGYPSLATGFGAAPFDTLGDNLRGTRGIMTDLLRRPEKVIAACEKIADMARVPDVPLGASPMVMMPLHKGSDYFMSQEQYETFYWPTFKQVMLKMIEEGLIPAPFAEGKFNERLATITELPRASTLWFFDQTDMHRAKEMLGDTCCIMGNVPITLISTGTAEQVKAYCKDLIETCAEGGGFILCPGTQIDDGQEETIQALVDSAKEYGVYE